MKCTISLLLLFTAVNLIFSKKFTTYNCWEQQNVSIAVDGLPSLYKYFAACLDKCHEFKKDERITVTSQLKSSVSVLRELYYRGQINLLMVQKYNGLYKKATNLCSAHPKSIPNWLIIKDESVPVSYDMDVMLTKDEKHVCNELIIISKELDRYGVVQLIPIPSFDDDRNPRYLILPYKNDFIIKINDTHEDTIIYKVYFESMKCMNIINTNPLKVYFLNKRFKRWIESTVIPISESIPDTLPGFGAIYRILSLAEAFEKKIEMNYKFVNKSNDEIIDGYPNMTFGLMSSKHGQNNVQIHGLLKNIHLNELIVITLAIIIILILFISNYVFHKKWKKFCNLIPAFQLDLNNVSDDEMKKVFRNKEIKINGPNGCHDHDFPSHVRVLYKPNFNDSSRDTCNDVMTINSERHSTLTKNDFAVCMEKTWNSI